MKYRFLSLIVLMFSFASAFGKEKPVVVTTVTMINDMAQNIFGDKADVQCFVPIGGDPHLFEPTPKSAELVNGADLVIKNGLTLEGKWLEKLINNSGTKAKVIATTDGVSSYNEVGHASNKDPHAWMNALNGVIYAENILKGAKDLLPEHAAYFEANFAKYKTELEQLNQYIEGRVQEIPEQYRVLVTSHDAFQYFGKKYGVKLQATMGTSTEADVQTSDIIALQKVLKETGVPAIFVESTVNPKLIKQVAKDNGIKIGGKLYADSVGDKDSGADTYIKMLRYNTDVIANALTKSVTPKAKTETASEEGFGQVYLFGALIVVLLIVFLFLRRKKK